MGIYNRDYFRNDNRPSAEGFLASAFKWIIAANVVVYILQLVVPDNAVTELFDLSPVLVLHGQVWRLVTYAFCHEPGSPFHILFNMLFLYWFGATLERMYGTREFMLFYFVSAFISGLAFLALALVMHDRTPAIGASGAVMAVVMLYAIHFPRDEMYFLLFRVQIRFLVLFYIVVDLWPVLRAFSGQAPSDGVAHAAHLGGLAFGFLYYHFHLHLDRGWGSLKNLRAPRIRIKKPPESIRVYDPYKEEDRGENLDVKVDAILAKIQAHGEASLTEQERETLIRASQRYKENLRNR
jgi:membrane associated rhomboid family serine protease